MKKKIIMVVILMLFSGTIARMIYLRYKYPSVKEIHYQYDSHKMENYGDLGQISRIRLLSEDEAKKLEVLEDMLIFQVDIIPTKYSPIEYRFVLNSGVNSVDYVSIEENEKTNGFSGSFHLWKDGLKRYGNEIKISIDSLQGNQLPVLNIDENAIINFPEYLKTQVP